MTTEPAIRRGRGVALSTSASAAPASADDQVPVLVDLARCDDNPYQPRMSYDDDKIIAIGESIKEHGLLQVPLARRVGDRYQLAFGHNRKRAFQLLALDDAKYSRMPLIIRDIDDETMALHAWTENKDRSDLTAFEEAMAIKRFQEEFNWTQQQTADRMKLSRPTVANKLRLLALPQLALDLLKAGQLTERQAAALLPLGELPENLWTVGTFVRNLRTGTYGAQWNGNAGDLIAHIAEKQFSSDVIREVVGEFINCLTLELEKVPWDKTPFLDSQNVVAPTCKECPIRLKSSNRCPNRGCFAEKSRLAAISLASAGAVAVGLRPAAPPASQMDYDQLYTIQQIDTLIQTAEERGCTNLSVIYTPNRHIPHPVDGHAGCAIVCNHGTGKRCACKMSLERGKNADPMASERAYQNNEKKRIREELFRPAEQHLAAKIAFPDAAVWRLLLRSIHPASASKLPASAGPGEIRAAIAKRLVENAAAYWDYSPSVPKVKKQIIQLFEELELDHSWLEDSNDQPA